MQFPESDVTRCTENIMTAIAPYLRKELGEERDNHVYNRVFELVYLRVGLSSAHLLHTDPTTLLRIIRQFGNDFGGETHGTI